MNLYMKDSVSVIIPTRNRCSILLQVLPSYMNQPGLKELIVIDDCSSDQTQKAIEKFISTQKKIRYFRNVSHLGSTKSRNIGVNLARGEYIFFGEDDLRLKKGHFSVLISHLKRNKADIISARRINIWPEENEEDSILRTSQLETSCIDRKMITTKNWALLSNDQSTILVDASMLVKREVFRKILFDENYKGNYWREESDFQVSCVTAGYKLIHCPHISCFHIVPTKNYGGCHSQNILLYEYWVLKNNYYFISKHWEELKKICLFKKKSVYFLNFSLFRGNNLITEIKYGLLKKN